MNNSNTKKISVAKKEEDDIPVFYCKDCLSLRIRDMGDSTDTLYCDSCGSTDIDSASIDEWEVLYMEVYGHNFINKEKKNGKETKNRNQKSYL